MSQLQLLNDPAPVRHWWLFSHGRHKWLGSNPTREDNMRSLVWICEDCGLVWARSPAWENNIRAPWHVITVCCTDCGEHEKVWVPGSLRVPWDKEYDAAMPEDVLRREVLLAAAFLDNGGDPTLFL